jgi:hypothetical protein
LYREDRIHHTGTQAYRHTGLQAYRKTGTEKNSEDFWSKTEENRQIHGIL